MVHFWWIIHPKHPYCLLKSLLSCKEILLGKSCLLEYWICCRIWYVFIYYVNFRVPAKVKDIDEALNGPPHTPATFLSHALFFFARDDLRQSAHKLWMASSDAIKISTRSKGVLIESHRGKSDFVRFICKQVLEEPVLKQQCIVAWRLIERYIIVVVF